MADTRPVLARVEADLRGYLVQTEADEQKLRKQLDTVIQDRRRADRALKALDRAQNGKPPPAKTKKAPRRAVSEEAVERVLQAIEDCDPEPTTSPDIQKATGLSAYTVDNALRVLREDREAIRLAGTSNTNARQFRAMEVKRA